MLVKVGISSDEYVPMTAILVKTGRVLPHEIALKLLHFVYRDLGVPARYLYIKRKMTKPTTCESTPEEILRPCTMKYEM